MKNVLIVLLSLAAFLSCNSSSGDSGKTGYDIKGKFANGAGQTLYLDKLSLSNATPVDTAIINAAGEFELKGTLPEKALYMLRISQDKTWLLVVQPGDEITFNGDLNDVFKYELKGSAESKVLNDFIKNVGTKNQQMGQLNQDFMNARMNGGDQTTLTNMQNQYMQLSTQLNNDIKNFSDTVSYPLLAVFSGSLMNMEANAAYLETLLNKQEPKLPNSAYISEFRTKLSQFTKLAEGKDAPDFEIKNPKGETIKLSSLKGQLVLLDFWASWCRPCRAENPNVVAAYAKYRAKGFTVFNISLDDNMEQWVQAIQADNLNWPYHGSELKKWNSEIGRQYNVQSIPTNFLIDKNGKIIGKNLRGAALEAKLAEVLGS
jgi:peroxiredoxin